jgi:hypothetical protein
MYMQRTTSGAAGNGLYTTIKYTRGAAGIGLGTTIKHLRRTTSGTANNGLGETMKYLRRTTSAAANNGLSTTVIPPCSAASFEVNSEPHTGARPSVSLCVGPELARCVHIPTHHDRPKHSLQNHSDQQHNSRHYAASDARARGRSCFALPYSNRSE